MAQVPDTPPPLPPPPPDTPPPTSADDAARGVVPPQESPPQLLSEAETVPKAEIILAADTPESAGGSATAQTCATSMAVSLQQAPPSAVPPQAGAARMDEITPVVAMGLQREMSASGSAVAQPESEDELGKKSSTPEFRPKHADEWKNVKQAELEHTPIQDKDKTTDKWKHGVIEFHNTNWQTKYLIVPEECASGEELVAVITWLWNLPLPKLVVELQGAETHYNRFREDVIAWESEDDPDWKEDRIAAKSMIAKRPKAEGSDVDSEDSDMRHSEANLANLSGLVEEVANGIISACAECGGWLLNKSQGRAATVPNKESKYLLEGKTVLMQQAMKEFHRQDGHGVVSFVYTCLRSLFGWRKLQEKAVGLNKDAEDKVIYPNICWYEGNHIDCKHPAKTALYNEIDENDPITPNNSLTAYCATHLLLFDSLDPVRVKDWLQEGLDRIGVCRAPVYMHGDYSLANKIMVDTAPVVILLKGTGGATDVCAEGQRRLLKMKEDNKRKINRPRKGKPGSTLKKNSPAKNAALVRVEHYEVLPSKGNEKSQGSDRHPAKACREDKDLAEIQEKSALKGISEAQLPSDAEDRKKMRKHQVLQTRTKTFCGSPRSSIKICEIRANTPEQMIDRLLLFMNMVQDGESEKMGEKDNDTNRLKQAAVIFDIYGHNAACYYIWCNIIEMLSVFVSASTTLVSVTLAYLTRDNPIDSWGPFHGKSEFNLVTVLSWASSVLPIIAGFILAVSQSFNPRTKWAQLSHAGNRIESAVWKFRARAGEYNVGSTYLDATKLHQGPHGKVVQKAMQKNDTKERGGKQGKASGKEELGANGKKRTRRDVFAKSMKDIQTAVRTSELRTASLDVPWEVSWMDKRYQQTTDRIKENNYLQVLTADRKEFNQVVPCDGEDGFFNTLTEDVSQIFISRPRRCWMHCCGRKSRQLPEKWVVESAYALSSEEYIKSRLLPRRKYLLTLAPQLSSRLFCLRMFLIAATSINALLGLGPFKQWIAAVVAVTTAMEVIMRDQMLDQRLRSTNAAILSLENLLTWWNSLTMVERRMPENYDRLVTSCEEVAYADMVWLPQAEKGSTAKPAADPKRKPESGGNSAAASTS